MRRPYRLSFMIEEDDNHSVLPLQAVQTKHSIMIVTSELKKRIQAKLDYLDLSLEEDVAELQPVVLPTSSFMMKDLPNLQMFIYESRVQDAARIAAALMTTLNSWPIFRSIAVDSEQGDPVLVILRNNERYLKHAIGTPIELPNVASLSSLRILGNHRKGEVPRGLLFRATVFKIIDSGICAVAFFLNHVVWDAIALSQWHQSFEACLMGHSLGESVPHSLFSEIYRSNVQSPAAKEAAAFHVKRLQGIGTLKSSLWPLFESLKSKDAVPSGGESATEQSLEAVETYTVFKHLRLRRIPMMPKFQAQYSIRPAIIVKAAIAIVNCIATDTKVAILLQLLAGRSWPFVGDEIASKLPDPYKIAGPTFATAIDIVKIDKEETVGGLLRRLTSEQKLLGRYAHCPPDFPSLLDSEDQATLLVSKRQVFNWLPFGFNKHAQTPAVSVLKLLERRIYHVDEPRHELTWRCGLQGEDDQLSVEAIQITEIFSPSKISAIVDQALQVTEELCNGDNFDKKVKEVMDKAAHG